MRRVPVLFLLLLVVPAIPAWAQSTPAEGIFFDAIPFAGTAPDSARLDLYLAVPYTALGFDRRDGRFAASYQLKVRVTGNGRTWLDSAFVRTVETASYESTAGNRPAYEFYQHRLPLPPGSYTATAELLDIGRNRTSSESRELTISGYGNSPFALSGLMLVRKIREDAGGHVITPMMSETVRPEDDGYFLFFEAYNNSGMEQFRIEAGYRESVDSGGNAPVFERRIPAGRSQQWIRVSSEGMPRGIFTVVLRVSPQDAPSRSLASAERTVRFDGSTAGVPLAEEELNERITQLRYIATQSEIDNIRAALTLLDRQRRYSEYWARFDPTPNTTENEAMNEYFRRIDYAEIHFRSYTAGWLTDKGRIYVIYGPPDNVSTDPFRTDSKAVETWHYYRRNIRLIFMDESGFGDFRLTTPISPGEKYRYGT